jgi:hypothetical protein
MNEEHEEKDHLISLGGETLRQIERLVPLTLMIIMGGVILFYSTNLRVWLAKGMWPLVLLAVGALLVILMVKVGFTVIKAFFLVSAELSLAIFLSQSYCSSVGRTFSSDSALRSFLFVSFCYIAFAFFGALYESLKERLVAIGKGKRKGLVRKILMSAGYLLIAAICVGWIYAIMQPIVTSLCVFQ